MGKKLKIIIAIFVCCIASKFLIAEDRVNIKVDMENVSWKFQSISTAFTDKDGIVKKSFTDLVNNNAKIKEYINKCGGMSSFIEEHANLAQNMLKNKEKNQSLTLVDLYDALSERNSITNWLLVNTIINNYDDFFNVVDGMGSSELLRKDAFEQALNLISDKDEADNLREAFAETYYVQTMMNKDENKNFVTEYNSFVRNNKDETRILIKDSYVYGILHATGGKINLSNKTSYADLPDDATIDSKYEYDSAFIWLYVAAENRWEGIANSVSKHADWEKIRANLVSSGNTQSFVCVTRFSNGTTASLDQWEKTDADLCPDNDSATILINDPYYWGISLSNNNNNGGILTSSRLGDMIRALDYKYEASNGSNDIPDALQDDGDSIVARIFSNKINLASMLYAVGKAAGDYELTIRDVNRAFEAYLAPLGKTTTSEKNTLKSYFADSRVLESMRVFQDHIPFGSKKITLGASGFGSNSKIGNSYYYCETLATGEKKYTFTLNSFKRGANIINPLNYFYGLLVQEDVVKLYYDASVVKVNENFTIINIPGSYDDGSCTFTYDPMKNERYCLLCKSNEFTLFRDTRW